MRVAQVIPGLAKAAGPSAFCVRASEFLAQAGVEVDLHVGVLDKDSLLPQDQRVAVSEFGKTFRPARRPDVIHVHALWMMACHRAMAYARKNRIPYVVSAHGMLAPWALRHKWLKKRIAWWLYQKRDLAGAAMFHATAECEIKWLRDLGFRQPCVVAPLGSDLPDLNNAEAQRRQDVKTVLFVGRIYPVKGLMNLVKAWARVKRSALVHYCDSSVVDTPEQCQLRRTKTNELMNSRTNELPLASSLILQPSAFPTWQLVIAGPDQAGHKAELVAEAERLGLTVADVTTNELTNSRTHELSPDILFTGPVYGAEKDALYRLADLFVLPSYTENFGVVVTDALAFGVPVITTKGTPWSELLGNSDHSSLVHYCDSSLVGKLEDGGGSSLVHYCDSSLVGKLEDGGGSSTNELMNSRTNELPLASSFILHPSSFAAFGRCGWWVDIGVEPLAEALSEAMRLTDAERCQLGLNGRRLVETKYTWPAVAAELKRAYERVLAPGDETARVEKR